MALDLGELSGRIGMDINPLKRDLAAGKTALRGHVADAEQAGEDAGESFTSGWGDKAKQGAAVAAAAVVGAMVYGINQGLEREASSDKLAAQLGLDPRQQARAGRVAGNLYANAWGESMGEVNTALGAVMSSFDGMAEGSRRKLRGLTIQALDYGTAFEVDVARGVQVAGQLVETGLAKNATAAFDLIVAGSQRVPAAVREDLLDASDEYGQFFASLGFNGREAFGLLVKASEDGMYGIDKAGDAIKEFTIRSTDMSASSKEAYHSIGLDAREMADDILAGGDDAKRAFDKIVTGLLDIESPSRRANEAIKLFGTPLEDLNVKEIPDFLRGLRDGSEAMDGFKGSAKEMGDTLNDNAAARVTSFKRKLETQLINYLASDVIPFLEDDVFPALEGIGDALDNVPSWAIKGSVGGLFGLIAAGKIGSLVGDLRGLRGGGGGSLAGTVGSSLKPVPVFVTNPGFGTGVPGGPGGGKVPPVVAGGTPSKLGSAAKFGAKAFLPATLLAAGHGLGGDEFGAGANAGGSSLGIGGSYSIAEGLERTAALRDSMSSTVGDMVKAGVTGAQDVVKALSILPEELITSFEVDGVPESRAAARDLVNQYDLTPAEKKTLFRLLGYETARSQILQLSRDLDWAARPREARINITRAFAAAGHQTLGGLQERAGGGPVTRGMPYLVGEREPELFVPHTSGRIFNQQQMASAGMGDARGQFPRTVTLIVEGKPFTAIARREIEANESFMEAVR